MHALYLGLGFEFTGGIGTLARAVVGILARRAAAGGGGGPAFDRLEVVTLHGPPLRPAAQAGIDAPQELLIRGCGGDRLRMARMVATRMRGGCALIVCEHVNLMPLVAATARRTIPCLCWIYSLEVWHGLSRLRRLALRRADCLLALAQASRRRTEAMLAGTAPIAVCYPGVADPLARPAAEPAAIKIPGPAAKIILTVGRLVRAEPYKGQAELIGAMPALLGRCPQVRLVVVGEGDGRPALMELALRLGVAHAVWFTGWQSAAQLDQWYRRAAIFAMPARLEGFGLVYLEAMAYGLPVVAADCDASPEIVEDGASGYLVPPGDSAALAERLLALLDEPELAAAMGRAGRARFLRDFTLEAFARRFTTRVEGIGRLPQTGEELRA